MSFVALLLAVGIAHAPVPSGAAISIDTRSANEWIGSHVDVEAWNRPEIAIDQEVSNGKPDDVRASIHQEGGAIAIVAEYTGERKSWLFGLIRHSWGNSFHWVVHVPENHSVHVTESNGSIKVTGVTAQLELRTSNGSIDVTGAGPAVEAQTSNGHIAVAVTTLRPGPPRLLMTSSNGSLTLHVPREFVTRVDAQTSNGRINNPFAGASGPGSASLRTSNGGVEITSGG